jgi:Glycosyltransferase Family 4
MRITQVSPPYEIVPPELYGGTERVVSYLTEELVNQGHDVTLFASGDSVTRARLVPCRPRSLRLDEQCIDHFASMPGKPRRYAGSSSLLSAVIYSPENPK